LRIQSQAEFDAKGIETVRRDGTPAEQKIEEKALKILFRTQDLSEVKRYFQGQCHKIMTGRVSIQDFVFAREVKLGMYSDRGPPPPGALIATKRMLADPRQEPQYGERVPFVVITGAPGARLIDRCVEPERLLKDDSVELDAEYYIGKNLIPPLERIFNLVGANVRAWYDEMPKVQRVRNTKSNGAFGGSEKMITGMAKKTLESYLSSTTCLVCKAKLPPPPPVSNFLPAQPLPLPICEDCVRSPARSLFTLRTRLHKSEQRVANIEDVCRSCSGFAFGEAVACDSRDCPVFYTRIREDAALRSLENRLEPVMEDLENGVIDERIAR
jgi:DNA polymerase zeta